MFQKIILDFNSNLFNELLTSTKFEPICKGREGAVLTSYKNDYASLVRTTTKYKTPAQKFKKIHYDIMDKIRKKIKNNIKLNNALIELYDSKYRRMGFHTDQSLDLEENSYICLYSCYEKDPSKEDLRKLKIKSKLTNKFSEITLDHNSTIIFSTHTNRNHLHKIVLESQNSKNRWLGITFRLAKTFIKFTNNIPHLYPQNTVLKLANKEERLQFYKHKKNENLSQEYNYPQLDFTISESDLMPIL